MSKEVKRWDELKALAEAFPSDLDWDSNTEPFFNGPTGESLGGGSDGTYAVYGKPFRLEGEDYDYDGPTYVERCNVEFAKFMVSAREGVLELLAERDALLAERDALKKDAECVDDLSALVRQLVQKLRKAAPESDLPERALDYLKRKGLQGSPFRSGTDIEDEAKRIYETWADHSGYVPWVERGNSLMQEEARRLALSALQGEQP